MLTCGFAFTSLSSIFICLLQYETFHCNIDIDLSQCNGPMHFVSWGKNWYHRIMKSQRINQIKIAEYNRFECVNRNDPKRRTKIHFVLHYRQIGVFLVLDESFILPSKPASKFDVVNFASMTQMVHTHFITSAPTLLSQAGVCCILHYSNLYYTWFGEKGNKWKTENDFFSPCKYINVASWDRNGSVYVCVRCSAAHSILGAQTWAQNVRCAHDNEIQMKIFTLNWKSFPIRFLAHLFRRQTLMRTEAKQIAN